MTVHEFVEECRREWRRLGVPDPIANEMAADLAADIEEAESEGGSAEDVLGNSAFDPRRFAGSWAVARGVTGPPVAAPTSRRWPVLVASLIGGAVLLALSAAVLLGSHQSAVSAVSVRRFLGGPQSIRIFPGAPIVMSHFRHFGVIGVFALLLLAGVVVVGIGLTVFGSRWNGGRVGRWEIRRHNAHSGSSRT
jgi:hypothetical protein